MKKQIGILALFLLAFGVTAIGAQAKLVDTHNYKTVGLNTFIEPNPVEIVEDGLIFTGTGEFLRWQREDRFRYIVGDRQYVENPGITDPYGLGPGYVAGIWTSHEEYLAYKKSRETGQPLGVTYEGVYVEPESGSMKQSNCIGWA